MKRIFLRSNQLVQEQSNFFMINLGNDVPESAHLFLLFFFIEMIMPFIIN